MESKTNLTKKSENSDPCKVIASKTGQPVSPVVHPEIVQKAIKYGLVRNRSSLYF